MHVHPVHGCPTWQGFRICGITIGTHPIPQTYVGAYFPLLPCSIAGLAFFDLSAGPEAVEKRLALLFFILLLFELLPFCYMSFYVADRRFFAADVSNDLYHPSAYYISAVIAGGVFPFGPLKGWLGLVRGCCTAREGSGLRYKPLLLESRCCWGQWKPGSFLRGAWG